MSFYKVAVAFAVVALGAAAVLAFPSFSPDVDAGLPASAVKADRLITPEPTKPEPTKPEPTKPEPAKLEPAKLEPAKPEPAKPEQVQPEQVKPEVIPEPANPRQAKPKKGKTQQAKPQQAKSQQAKPAQDEPRPTAKTKGCADNTLSYYAAKCQRTRTRIVNGVRTTRVLADDRQSQE